MAGIVHTNSKEKALYVGKLVDEIIDIENDMDQKIADRLEELMQVCSEVETYRINKYINDTLDTLNGVKALEKVMRKLEAIADNKEGQFTLEGEL